MPEYSDGDINTKDAALVFHRCNFDTFLIILTNFYRQNLKHTDETALL